ncbi:MAG: hypothetical protein M1379_03415 [Firmicutes bacterium]|nr:hypothetical protein [Bacillota bacterium]
MVESGRIKPTLASLLATGTGTAAGGQKISREEYDAIIRKITASAETLSEMAQTLQRTFSAFKF